MADQYTPTFTYKVTVTAKKKEGSDQFSENDLEEAIREGIEDLHMSDVFIGDEDGEDVMFSTSWEIELL